jgi:hypothetical protein
MVETPKKHEFHGYDRGARMRPRLALPRPRQQGAVAVGGEKTLAKRQAQDDKMSALRTFRRVRGLCDFCAEKWLRPQVCTDNPSSSHARNLGLISVGRIFRANRGGPGHS